MAASRKTPSHSRYSEAVEMEAIGFISDLPVTSTNLDCSEGSSFKALFLVITVGLVSGNSHG
jgi:cobalamin synthase